MPMSIIQHIKPLFILLLAVIITGCATNPVTGDSDFVLMSEDAEIAIGRKNHPVILKQYGLYDDPGLQKYVQRVGTQLASKSHRQNLIYRFSILDSAQVNAFALPGGYIYITRGLLAYLNSEAALAAVLGHEIGHVTARHGVRQQTAATLKGILGIIITSRTGSRIARDATNILTTALVRGYGREQELEADKLGAQYLARAGYSPKAMIDVIRVLKNQESLEKELAKKEHREPQIYHGVFATHPDNDKRLQKVIQHASVFKPTGLTSRKLSRNEFLQQLDGLVFGDSEQQGIRRGRNFYHKSLDIALRFPANWRIKNSPSALIATAPNGDGFIQMTSTDLNRKLSPRVFIQTRLNVDDFNNGRSISPDGLPGYTLTANISTPYGERKTRIAAIFYNDKAFVFFAAVKPTERLAQYDDLFLDTINSLHLLKPEEYKLAEPLRLSIIPTPENTSIKELAKYSRISNSPEQQLRLLNDLYPDGEPTTDSIKIIE